MFRRSTTNTTNTKPNTPANPKPGNKDNPNNNKKDNPDNKNDNKNEKDAKEGETGGSWFARNSGKLGAAAQGIGYALLAITGLYFLPGPFLQQLGNALFPFLPEEYRPIAMAGVSLCSYLCSVCISMSVLVLALQ